MSKRLAKGGSFMEELDRNSGVLVFLAFIVGVAVVVSASSMYSSQTL
jgi:hypothetical protein